MKTSIVDARASGFTLIELMVVILLVGLTLGVGLTLDFGSSPQQLEQQALQVANATELVAQEAVLSGTVWGLDIFTEQVQSVEHTGTRWLRLEAAGWVSPEMSSIFEVGIVSEKFLFTPDINVEFALQGAVLLPEPIVDLATLATNKGVKKIFSPEIVLLPTREITPFTLTLQGDALNFAQVTADLMGRVVLDKHAPASSGEPLGF